MVTVKGHSHIRCAGLRCALLCCAVRELVATFYRPLRWDAPRCTSTSNYVYFNGTVHTYAALHQASRNIFLFLLAQLVLAQHSAAQRRTAQRMCEWALSRELTIDL